MRLLCLTTDTPHHNFFVRQLNKICSNISVIIEANTINPKYETLHSFETERDKYERELWGLEALSLGPQDGLEIHHTASINKDQTKNILSTFTVDLCIVFGTGKISANIIESLPRRSFNLHGGDPCRYRGLDSHYWSIWHGDKNGLQTCLHRLTKQLDDGPIFDMRKLDLKNVNDLCNLRAENTRLCIAMCTKLIANMETNVAIRLLKQKKKGRYYSHMPCVLKNTLPLKFKNLREESA